MNLQKIILIFIVILIFIDYYHKQYRIKHSKKDIKYRNSHSVYDDTDYTKYRPYKEVYTYKIAALVLFIALILDTILNKNTYFLNLIFNFSINTFLFENWKEAIAILIITIIITSYNNKSKKFKFDLETIITYSIIFVIVLLISDIIK